MGEIIDIYVRFSLPVVVTDYDGYRESVRDGIDGFVIPERDPQAVCDRLDRLYRDPELRRHMGRSAAARALEVSWDAYATKALRVLAGGG